MHFFIKLASLVIMTMLMTLSSNLINAEESCADNGGCGYTECCRSTSLAPAIALGTIIVVGIVAVAVQNTSGHGHCHSHN